MVVVMLMKLWSVKRYAENAAVRVGIEGYKNTMQMVQRKRSTLYQIAEINVYSQCNGQGYIITDKERVVSPEIT